MTNTLPISTPTTRGVVLHVEDSSTLSIDAPWWPLLSYQPQRVLQHHQNVGVARGLVRQALDNADTHTPRDDHHAPLQSVFDAVHSPRVSLEWSPSVLSAPPLVCCGVACSFSMCPSPLSPLSPSHQTWRTTFLAAALPFLRIPAIPPGCAVHMDTLRLEGYM